MSPTKEAEMWCEYVAAVKKRDAARFKAEDADKERRAAWREYYAMEKKLKQMNCELGLDDVVEDEKKDECPPAPKKKRKIKPEIIDLTQ